MRRASRQLYANVPACFASSPYNVQVLSGSSPIFVSSGSEVCMRNAISY